MEAEGSPPGYDVFEQRVRMISDLLTAWCEASASRTISLPNGANSFVVTGIGSSEALARYFVALLEQAAGMHGSYRPLSSFSGAATNVVSTENATNTTAKTATNTVTKNKADRDQVLVVISQGISPNAWLALESRDSFRHTVLLTAATPESIAARNDELLLRRYEKLVADGCTVIHYPLANEYTILIRVVGPFFGYLACYELARTLSGGTLAPIDERQLRSVLMKCELGARTLAREDIGLLSQGFHIIAGSPLSLYGQNLCLKFLEGLFWHIPRLWNVLDISHGLVQQLSLAKRPVWLLSASGDTPRILELGEQVLRSVGVAPRSISSELPPYLEVLEFEMLFNFLILQLCRRFKVNQLEWPAKGLDLPLYSLGKEPAAD